MSARPYADPAHTGNKIRPKVRCIGCGKLGCGTAWGPWCIPCNVKRIDRISASLGAAVQPRVTAPTVGAPA